MLSLEQIKSQYPVHLQEFSDDLLREYLQYKILDIISHSKLAPKLSFLGGTALRIMHNNRRFSEDLDFDNFGLTREEFESISNEVRKGLEAEGMEVEISFAGHEAFRCNVRFPGLLFENGLSPMPEQKILLQIDTLAHGVDYEPELSPLNKFDVFTDLRTTPIAMLFSQKLYACVNRPRAKGRDFFDIVFLLSLGVIPDYVYLEQKISVANADELREYILDKTKEYDFEALGNDVAPFLFQATEVQKVVRFRDIFKVAKL